MRRVNYKYFYIYRFLWIYLMIVPFGICRADDGFNMETYINEFMISYEAKNEPFIYTLKVLSDRSECKIFINEPAGEESWLDAAISVKLKNIPLRFALEKVLAKAGITNYVLELDNKTRSINVFVYEQDSAFNRVMFDNTSKSGDDTRQQAKPPLPGTIPQQPGISDSKNSNAMEREAEPPPPPKYIPQQPGVIDSIDKNTKRDAEPPPPPKNIPFQRGVMDRTVDETGGRESEPPPPPANIPPPPSG